MVNSNDFFDIFRLIGTAPGVSAFCTSYEIRRCLIGRSGLHRPPISFFVSALIAGYPRGGQGHIVPVGYYNLHFGIFFTFHVILLFYIIA